MNLKYFNKMLFLVVILLCAASITTITALIPQIDALDYNQTGISFVIQQFMTIIVGIVLIFVVYNIELERAEFLVNIGYWILFGMLFILATDLSIFSMFIQNINGANGWFIIPGLGTIQPVEFMKIALLFKVGVISQKHVLSDRSDFYLIRDYVIYAGFPILMVLLQPDLGGLILLFVPVAAMFLMSLKNTKITLIIIAITLSLAALFIFLLLTPTGQTLLIKFTPLQFYQLSRIDAWLNPFTTDLGFQLSQSLILMGSGGLFGHGFGYDGILLPEPHTDVIFPEFVGMFGIIAGIILICMYVYITLEILNIASRTRVVKYKFLCVGFATLFIVQVFENIGMMIGLFPITGIVLPFMSYGSSALITYFGIIAISLKIDRDAKLG